MQGELKTHGIGVSFLYLQNKTADFHYISAVVSTLTGK